MEAKFLLRCAMQPQYSSIRVPSKAFTVNDDAGAASHMLL